MKAIKIPNEKQSRELSEDLSDLIFSFCDKYDLDKTVMIATLGELLTKTSVQILIETDNKDRAKIMIERFTAELKEMIK